MIPWQTQRTYDKISILISLECTVLPASRICGVYLLIPMAPNGDGPSTSILRRPSLLRQRVPHWRTRTVYPRRVCVRMRSELAPMACAPHLKHVFNVSPYAGKSARQALHATACADECSIASSWCVKGARVSTTLTQWPVAQSEIRPVATKRGPPGLAWRLRVVYLCMETVDRKGDS